MRRSYRPLSARRKGALGHYAALRGPCLAALELRENWHGLSSVVDICGLSGVSCVNADGRSCTANAPPLPVTLVDSNNNRRYACIHIGASCKCLHAKAGVQDSSLLWFGNGEQYWRSDQDMIEL